MSSRKEVAKMAGVSVTTVTNILNNVKPVSDEVRKRVYDAVKKLKYQPNVIAQGLRTKNSRQIGVIISDIGNPFFAKILSGIEEQAIKNNYTITIILINDSSVEEKYKDIVARKFKGIINISNIPCSESWMNEMIDSGSFLVNFSSEKSSCVIVESSIGKLMEAAFQLGHRKMMYIVGLPKVVAERDVRFVQYKYYYEKMGFVHHEKEIIYGDFPNTQSMDIGYKAIKDNWDQNNDISVIFCINDMCALGAISALKEMNISIPEDVSIVGYDNIEMSKYFSPPLTTIDVYAHNFGKELMDSLIRLIQGGEFESKKLNSNVVMRCSLAPVRNK